MQRSFATYAVKCAIRRTPPSRQGHVNREIEDHRKVRLQSSRSYFADGIELFDG